MRQQQLFLLDDEHDADDEQHPRDHDADDDGAEAQIQTGLLRRRFIGPPAGTAAGSWNRTPAS